MTSPCVLMTRVRGLFRKGRRDVDLTEEIQAHLDSLTEEYARRGLPPAAARAAARRDFGGVDQVKEAYRDERKCSLSRA